MSADLRILFEDNHVLAVVKPAALLTQAPAHLPSLENQVKAYLKQKFAKAGNVYLGIPHRLDRPVSGVVLFARNSKAAQRLAEQFQQRQVEKVYWALVEVPGVSRDPADDTWVDWLRKIPEEARAEVVPEGTEGAKRAETAVKVLARLPGGALLELRPHTGRTHQLRLQASSRGWPILGDALYGSTLSFGPATPEPRERWIALHARALTFLHPIRYEPISLTAPVSQDWLALAPEITDHAASLSPPSPGFVPADRNPGRPGPDADDGET